MSREAQKIDITEILKRNNGKRKITAEDVSSLKDNRGLCIPDPKTDKPQSRKPSGKVTSL